MSNLLTRWRHSWSWNTLRKKYVSGDGIPEAVINGDVET